MNDFPTSALPSTLKEWMNENFKLCILTIPLVVNVPIARGWDLDNSGNLFLSMAH